jgi:hypothetical protein
MAVLLEYHKTVQRAIPASLALFGMLSLPLLLISTSPAQNNSAASSGSARVVSPTPSVPSPGYTTHVSTSSGPTTSKTPPSSNANNNAHPQRPSANGQPYYYYPYVYAVPVPYTADVVDNGASDDNDPDYQGGPTVFDRRGSGPYSYIPPGAESNVEEIQARQEAQAQQQQQQQQEDAPTADSDAQPPPPPTILVFQDGHQLEIENYAIVNQTVYDLTPGHPRKIALADLDLQATQKQNDDRGLTFELPSSAQAN